MRSWCFDARPNPTISNKNAMAISGARNTTEKFGYTREEAQMASSANDGIVNANAVEVRIARSPLHSC